MEILKRLPAKTLTRFLSVSKLWASIIRRRVFMKLFLTESSNRPGRRLIFSFKNTKECVIFPSLQTQTLGESSSIATYNVTHPAYQFVIDSSAVHGLICYANASGSGLVAYNSSTRRSITLPEFEPGNYVVVHFLGYDPIDGVYKVLCLTGPKLVFPMAESESKLVFHVLTLGNGNSWKMIEFEHSHIPFPANSHICINGVVYYETFVGTVCNESAFVSFDVRSETFDHIKGPGGTDHLPATLSSTTIRYEGKLAIITSEISADGSMALWVLEDAVKHKWLKKVFVLPSSWTSLARRRYASPLSNEPHRFVNVTDEGELILAPLLLGTSPYYVLCYDPKRNSVRKVEVEGIAGHKLLRCKKQGTWVLGYLYASQVESLMFL